MLFYGAAGLAALAAPSYASDHQAGYELWRSVENGRTVIAVAEARKGGAYAVAAGETGALDVLAGKDAEKAMKALRARSDSVSADSLIVISDKDAGDKKQIVRVEKKEAKAGEDGEKRIVIVKAGEGVEIEGDDIEIEDADIDIQNGRRVEIVRIEKRAAGDDHADHADHAERSMKKSKKKTIILEGDDEATADIDGLEKTVIELDDAKDGESRFLKIAGADGEAVADFIDDMGGLDADEKRALKSAVGL